MTTDTPAPETAPPDGRPLSADEFIVLIRNAYDAGAMDAYDLTQALTDWSVGAWSAALACFPGDIAIPVLPAPAREVSVAEAARDVLAERERQKAVEGWTPEHDDEHDNSELAQAAACYALNASGLGGVARRWWPWDHQWWKPTTDRRDLVKAGALILAEIERLDRLALSTPTEEAEHGR